MTPLEKCVELIQTEQAWDRKAFNDEQDLGDDDEIGTSDNACVVGVGKNLGVSRYYQGPCHAGLKRLTQRHAVGSFDMTDHRLAPELRGGFRRNRPPSPEIAKAYYTWLYGPDSPWVSVFGVDGTEAEHTTYDFRRKFGVVIGNTDQVSARMLGNAFIAQRRGWECYKAIERWYEYVKAGVHPSVAFWFCRFFDDPEQYGNSGKFAEITDPGHWPVNYHNVGPEYFENFVLGKPGNVTAPEGWSFRTYGNYHPCNSVWAKYLEMDYNRNTYQHVPVGGKQNYLRFLEQTYDFKNKGCRLTLDDVIKIAKQEGERLGLT